MKKKIIGLILWSSLAAGILAGCGNKDNVGEGSSFADGSSMSGSGAAVGSSAADNTAGGNNNPSGNGKVYYLSFKPEVDPIWQNLAAQYTQETGVEVKVVTAANGTYEQTLMSEIANTDAPTLFQINGPIGYLNWQEYCADLSGTNLYSWLLDKSLAVTGENGGVYGIPYVVEGYGIIYNSTFPPA